jgi:hypothetical protein
VAIVFRWPLLFILIVLLAIKILKLHNSKSKLYKCPIEKKEVWFVSNKYLHEKEIEKLMT